MENILKKIAEFDKVNETKLAKHEVDLATMDDYNRSVFGDETWIEQLNDFVTKSSDLIKQLQMRVEGGLFVGAEAKKAINKTLSMESQLEKAIKELGIPAPAEFQKNKDKIRKIQSDVNTLVKKLESFNK